MKERLIWVLEQLNKVRDELNAVRDVGDMAFKGARDELQDIINKYAEPVAPAPVVVTQDLDEEILAEIKEMRKDMETIELQLTTLALAEEPVTEVTPA